VRLVWLWWLALAVGAFLLLSQVSSLTDAIAALVAVDPRWVFAGLGLVVIRFVAAAVSLQAAVRTHLGFRSAVVVQLAAAFVSRLTPEGVGWVVVTQRYLEAIGLPRAHALAVIALKVAASGVTRVAIIAVVAVLAGTTGLVRFDIPAVNPLLLAVVPVALLGVVATVLLLRPYAAAIVRLAVAAAIAAVEGLRDLAGEPLRLAALLVSTAWLTILSVLVLAVSAIAFGADVLLLEVFVVYLASSAVASLSPTPGNLGASELAFTAGLVAIGVAPAVALAAVLLYRLLTFWLPVMPGLIAFRYLQARGSI
jgi:undecaprenyl-diphosphatase